MQMSQTLQSVYSVYGDDPNLAELVEIFVSELPRRVETLQSHAEVEDWESFARVAHQINGNASSYGFPQLSTLAARIEYACRGSNSTKAILQSLDNFIEYCEQIRAGVPGKRIA
ncbi:Hpt domain-containing protein [Bythopirellula polymerisocia]|uniref:Hpt domain protein n=1 Tax=Bythopirellula polymerisocia TaxID=2528003 RepID=A0A5C6CUD9_9BACT|nr:Hpt domain-containing protein [Bythopirellula polymerisocia]TWU28573.1 Hpt domain protein [Bythopirellula polymerisocia]